MQLRLSAKSETFGSESYTDLYSVLNFCVRTKYQKQIQTNFRVLCSIVDTLISTCNRRMSTLQLFCISTPEQFQTAGNQRSLRGNGAGKSCLVKFEIQIQFNTRATVARSVFSFRCPPCVVVLQTAHGAASLGKQRSHNNCAHFFFFAESRQTRSFADFGRPRCIQVTRGTKLTAPQF